MDLPATFQDRVKEKIDIAISEFIPPDALDKLVQARITSFTRDDLPKLIETMIKERLVDLIKTELNAPAYQQRWAKTGGELASAAVEQVLIGAAPMILSGVVGMISQRFIEQLRNNMPRPY